MVISIFGLLFACGGNEEYVVPDHILSKEKIIPLIVDVQILESHFQRSFKRTDLYKDALDSSAVLIFDAHGTTKEIFDNSMGFYALTPDTLYSIYEAALDTINVRIDMGR